MVLELLERYHQEWNVLMNENSDQRTSKWIFMSSPFPVLGITIGYLILIKKILPEFMDSRKPLKMKNYLLTFNIFHVLGNTFFFYNYLWYMMTDEKFGNLRCQAIDRSPFGNGLKIARYAYGFMIFKMVDLIETVFLVLSKRYELITPYHVAHHFLMVNMVWGSVKFVPGGHATFFAFVNSFCHMIMYSYLVLLGLFPKLKRNFPWFRPFRMFVGAAEIIVIAIHTLQLLFKNDCNFPIEFVYYGITYALIYLVLFIFWHHHTDTKERKSPQFLLVDENSV